jgi:hypothetical protein
VPHPGRWRVVRPRTRWWRHVHAGRRAVARRRPPEPHAWRRRAAIAHAWRRWHHAWRWTLLLLLPPWRRRAPLEPIWVHGCGPLATWLLLLLLRSSLCCVTAVCPAALTQARCSRVKNTREGGGVSRQTSDEVHSTLRADIVAHLSPTMLCKRRAKDPELHKSKRGAAALVQGRCS